MKNYKCILVATILSFPVITQAETIPLTYDDNVFESSTSLNLPTTTGDPPGVPAPAVQFDAPGTGVYALESVSFHLLQSLGMMSNPDGSPGLPTGGDFKEPTPQTYPVTVKIWTQNPDGTAWIPEDPLDADLIVTRPGLYVLSMQTQEVAFTGSIRLAIFLRKDGLVPIPEIPVHLGVDSDGIDSTPSAPFGHSYRYNSAGLFSANPWIPAIAANYGVRASVHLVPRFKCQGFLPPFDDTTTVTRGGRTIPLKAMLLDDAGVHVTRSLLTAPPRVQLLHASDKNVVNPIDVTDALVPAGRSAAGQSFSQTEGNVWSYNFKTSKELPAGTYTVQMESGDGMEYLIDRTCVGTFVIENLKQSNPAETQRDSKLKPSKGLK